MEYGYQDLINHFDEKVIQKGREYLGQGRVDHVKFSQNGSLVTGRVTIKPGQVFRLCLTLHENVEGHLAIESECTCQISTQCRHAAAVMLYGLQHKPVLPAKYKKINQWDEAYFDLSTAQNDLFGADDSEEQVQSVLSLVYLLSADQTDIPALKVMLGNISRSESKVPTLIELEPFRIRQSLLKPVRGEDISSLHESDRRILALLDYIGTQYRWSQRFEVIPLEYISEVVLNVVKTGRAFLLSEKVHVISKQEYERSQKAIFLRSAPSLKLSFYWQMKANGCQTLSVKQRESSVIWKSFPPLLLEPDQGIISSIDTSFSPDTLKKIFNFSVLPLDIGDFWKKECDWLLHYRLPAPQFLRMTVEPSFQPEVHVHFASCEARGMAHFSQSMIHVASVRFSYRGQFFSPKARGKIISFYRQGQLFLSMREAGFEKMVIDEFDQFDWLYSLLGQNKTEVFNRDDLVFMSQSSLQQWILDKVPQFKARGWNITWDDSFKFSLNQVDSWRFYLDSSHQDWFHMGLSVMVGNEEVELLPLLLSYFKSFSKADLKKNIKDIANNAFIILPFKENKNIAIESRRVRQIITTLVELLDNNPPVKEGGRLMLPMTQVARVAELEFNEENDRVEWHGALEIRKWAEALRHPTFMQEITLPAGFLGELRPYQYEGVQWLQFLRSYHLGGVLADDMGLGKTVQTLAHLAIEFAEKRMVHPVLIIAPTSLLGNWRKEAKRFLPHIEVLVWHGLHRKLEHDPFKFPLIITTYAVLVRDFRYLETQKYAILILDEAQLIKNARTKVAKSIKKIKAEHRLCLTGTPLENHIGELWSLFDFLMPGFLGSEQQFRKLYRNPIEKRGDTLRCQALIKRLAPFMLRRTKEQVARDLPPKTEIVKLISLNGEQSDFYESIRLSMNQKVQNEIARKGLAASQIIILDALLKLRQVCCDPRIVKLETAKKIQESAKLQYLTSMLIELVESGHCVLVFSQFTSMLDLIAAEIESVGLTYVTLTGKTRHRDLVVDQFQEGKAPIFLISLKAGGTGLNLTRADTVIHYDPWWNPAVERQASDRAYRIGQNKPVFVYKLIAEGTVEEKIHVLQEQKHQLLKSVVNGSESISWHFDEEDLQSLFAPIT